MTYGSKSMRARSNQHSKVHVVRLPRRDVGGYVIQNCDGRAIRPKTKSDLFFDDEEPLTCKRCQEHEHR